MPGVDIHIPVLDHCGILDVAVKLAVPDPPGLPDYVAALNLVYPENSHLASRHLLSDMIGIGIFGGLSNTANKVVNTILFINLLGGGPDCLARGLWHRERGLFHHVP
jgi:hypothetical protein